MTAYSTVVGPSSETRKRSILVRIRGTVLNLMFEKANSLREAYVSKLHGGVTKMLFPKNALLDYPGLMA